MRMITTNLFQAHIFLGCYSYAGNIRFGRVLRLSALQTEAHIVGRERHTARAGLRIVHAGMPRQGLHWPQAQRTNSSIVHAQRR